MTNKQYGIKVVYINNTTTESIYDNEDDRDIEFSQWKNFNWQGTVVYNNCVVNLANVVRVEKFTRKM